MTAGERRTTAAILAAALLVSGCVKNKVLIKVKGDGSGHIVVTQIFSREAVGMFEQQMKQMEKFASSAGPGAAAMKSVAEKDPFFDEQGIGRQARFFGQNVKLVKASRYDQNGARGHIAVYSFPDINDVSVSLGTFGFVSAMSMGDADAMEGMESLMSAKKAEDTFEFVFATGAVKRLRIVMPPVVKADPKQAADADTAAEAEPDDEEDFGPLASMGAELGMGAGGPNPYGFTGKESPREMAKRMARGCEIGVEIEVEGALVRSNASHPDKANAGHLLLYKLDLERAMASPKVMKAMRGEMETSAMSSPGAMFSCFNGVPGLTVETNSEVVVEFQ